MSTFTLDTLPERGHVFVFLTGERWSPAALEFGDADERGWVDPRWSLTDLYESRNDASPVWDAPTQRVLHGHDYGNGGPVETAEDVRADLFDAIREHVGFVDHSERGTLYAADYDDGADLTSPDVFAYAAHVHVKWHDPARGWVEDPVHVPAEVINAA